MDTKSFVLEDGLEDFGQEGEDAVLDKTAERADMALVQEEDAEEENLLLKLSKPYTFEGRKYTEVDLSGLEGTTGRDLSVVGKIMAKKCPGMNPATLELTKEYAEYMAAGVTHLPVEFFQRLPARDSIKLKGKVVGFLYGGDGEN